MHCAHELRGLQKELSTKYHFLRGKTSQFYHSSKINQMFLDGYQLFFLFSLQFEGSSNNLPLFVELTL